jgi:FkbM family methyltransferase
LKECCILDRDLSGKSQQRQVALDGNSASTTLPFFHLVLQALTMMTRNENLIYDIGMHRGEDTDFYLRKGFDVIGFEANPRLVGQCKIRFQDAIVRGRLRIVEGAIAPAAAGDSITFYVNVRSQWGTMHPSWAERNASLGAESRKIKVKRIDLHEVFRDHGMPYYMKITIEGSDVFVLSCLKEYDCRPVHISVESEKVAFSALTAEISTFVELGYSKFRAVQQALIPGSTLTTKTLKGEDLDYTFENHASGPFGDDVAQPWRSADEIIEEYRGIFDRYRAFGDRSLFAKAPRQIRRLLEIAYKLKTGYRGPLPGWFDTHASL